MITVTVKHKAISVNIVTEYNLTCVYANEILLIRDNSSASSYPIFSISQIGDLPFLATIGVPVPVEEI